MKARKALVIILTVLIFLSCAMLGFATVFRIDSVQVNPTAVSAEAMSEAEQMQDLLTKAYQSENTVFVKDTKAREIVNGFPYFRFVAFKKAYPNRLVIEVAEDAEVYAVAKDIEQTEFYILNAQGMVLGVRDNYRNRADSTGKEYNVLLSGFTATGNKGETLTGTGNYPYLFSVCQKADELLGGIRGNVVSAEIQGGASPETVVLKLVMREGVSLCLRNPSQKTLEKTKALIDYYTAKDGQGLTDQQRTRGALVVQETAGQLQCVYFDQDLSIE